MRIMTAMTAIAASLALAACDQSAVNRTTDGRADGPPIPVAPPEEAVPPLSAQAFANTLAAGDAFEIATSRLAVDRAPTPSIKAFAQKMVDTHTASTDRLKKDAGTLTPAIKPDPALTAEQQKKLDALKALTGTAFEQGYIADQVAAHETALGIVRTYAENGDVPELKRFAVDAVQMVSEHLAEARRLATPTVGAI